MSEIGWRPSAGEQLHSRPKDWRFGEAPTANGLRLLRSIGLLTAIWHSQDDALTGSHVHYAQVVQLYPACGPKPSAGGASGQKSAFAPFRRPVC